MSKKFFTTESLATLVNEIKAYVANAISTKVDNLSDLGVTATATELNYCDGVTSSIQTQLDGKASSSHGVHVPSCSASNNGQFLRVVGGTASWSTVPNAEDGEF